MAKTKTAKKTTAKKATTKKTAAKSTKKAPAKKKSPAKPAASRTTKKRKAKAGDQEVTLDRRNADERRGEEAAEAAPAKPALERREKVNRRRQIDPTTCERDYSDAEVEFMNALEAYKRTSGRMFPTCSEVLEVVRAIGYVQLSQAELATIRAQRGECDEAVDIDDAAAAEAQEALATSDELRVD